jgi:hypothetical protein
MKLSLGNIIRSGGIHVLIISLLAKARVWFAGTVIITHLVCMNIEVVVVIIK